MLTTSSRISSRFLNLTSFKWTFIRNGSGFGTNKNIQISKFGEAEDHQMVTTFLLNNYYPIDPLGLALGLNAQKEVKPWLAKYIKKQFSNSPSVSSQAIDESTGKVVGMSVAVIFDPKKGKGPSMVDYLDPNTHPVYHQIRVFIEEIEEGLDPAELLGIKGLVSDADPRILNNLMFSIHKDYWRQGIGTELLKENVKLAKKDKDCLAAKAITTSESSYKAYLKVGYQVIREFQLVKYKNPVSGVKIFEGRAKELGENLTSRFMIKDMSSTTA